MNYHFYFKDGRPAFQVYCVNCSPTPECIAYACDLLQIKQAELEL